VHTTSQQRLNPWLVNGLLVAAAVLVALLPFEIGLRVRAHLQNQRLLRGEEISRGVEVPADRHAELGHMIRMSPVPDVIYELKPDLTVIYQGAEVITDDAGFRVDGDITAPPPGAECIVGIGDSFMFGQGVAAADTYLAVMGRGLAERRPGHPLRVVNTAVPGYNTVMEVAALRAKGLTCDPVAVIVDFVGNDLSLPNFVRQPQNPWSLRRSFLNDFVRQRLGLSDDDNLFRELLDAGLRGVPQEDLGTLGNAVDPEMVPPEYRGLVGWDAYAGAMRELRDLAHTHGFEVVSIALGPEDSALKRQALDLSRELGFHVVDIGARFRAWLDENGYAGYPESPLALRPDDGHPSVLAHRMAGEILATVLDEEVLPPPSSR